MSLAETQTTLRPARGDIEDGLVYAKLVEQAQQGAYRWMLGPHVQEIVGRAFTEPGHEHSYRNVTFAERAGDVVGMGSGYSSSAHGEFTNEPLETAAGRRRHRMAVFLRLAGRKIRFLDHVPDGDFYVRALAVDQEHRSKGIGTMLLERLEIEATTAGSRRLALDVAAKNSGARRLYERFGMTKEAESPRWFGIPNTNIIRMVKDL